MIHDNGYQPDKQTEETMIAIPQPFAEALDAIYGVEPPAETFDSLHAKLDAWWNDEVPVVYYGWLDTLIGRVYVGMTQQGVASVDFGYPSEAVYVEHFQTYHLPGKRVRMRRQPEQVASAIRQLEEYFGGEREYFDLPIDLSLLTQFQRSVLEATSSVPRGEIVTYKEIARRIGKPKASRAVGNALGRNPVPIVIPCHRVLPQNGSLGGYSGGGGPDTKATLLKLEGVLPQSSGRFATA